MPNWCSNNISITGSKTSISKIKKVIESIEDSQSPVVFEKLVGIEPTITQEDYDKGGWYNSNVNYWGTKWDVNVNECNFIFEDQSIHMSPDTAWSPPIGFGVALAKKYKVEVTMDYEEPGCDFCGRTLIEKNGEKDEEDYSFLEGKYYFDNESFWYEIDSEIEYYRDENDEGKKSVEEYVEERYSFVSEEDKKEIIKMFKDE